jgi:hypothetical protein
MFALLVGYACRYPTVSGLAKVAIFTIPHFCGIDAQNHPDSHRDD